LCLGFDWELYNWITWYSPRGAGASRFFANRSEHIALFGATERYYFNLDAVREPYSEKEKKYLLRYTNMLPQSIEKGHNPTNVWEISHLPNHSLERVGHPQQKPAELVRRLVRGLSYPGSLVLDFLAGSCITGRVACEEGRHSILGDQDAQVLVYFERQLEKLEEKHRAGAQWVQGRQGNVAATLAAFFGS
jgi:site-specific DNA-methyltransferase (adenine-specific)